MGMGCVFMEVKHCLIPTFSSLLLILAVRAYQEKRETPSVLIQNETYHLYKIHHPLSVSMNPPASEMVSSQTI